MEGVHDTRPRGECYRHAIIQETYGQLCGHICSLHSVMCCCFISRKALKIQRIKRLIVCNCTSGKLNRDMSAVMEAILTSVVSKVGEYMVEPTIRQVRYMVCFNSIIKDLMTEYESLESMQDEVHNLVQIAERNAEEIVKNVQKWLDDVDSIKLEVRSFKDEIEANKRCINGWCPNWRWRYRLGKKLTKKITTITGLQQTGKFNSVSHPAPPPGIELLPSGNFMTFESTKSAFIQIIEALRDDKTNIIGVYGMGGVGKTTLVKEVGKRAKESELFDQVVMAVVSQTIKIKEIQGQIADMLGLRFDEETETGRAGRLCLRLKKEKKILIILDDVWKHLNLAEIGIPFGVDHRGCKIVLTSRLQQVFTSMGIQRKIALNIISKEEAWALFKENASVGDSNQALNDVAMKVSRECQGLPIAIVTVGRTLRDKSLDEWEEAAQQLSMSQHVVIEGVNIDVYKCIKLSYDYLVSEEAKLCFLYCCLFPEDYAIDVEDLCRYVVGKGLFQDVDTIEKARRKVRIITNNLKASCLLLNHDGEQFFRMHDVVRDVALQIASKGKHTFMTQAGFSLKKWPEKVKFGHCTAISLMANELCELPDGLECPKLETLLLGRNKACVSIPASFFEGMKGLRVLDLSHSRGQEWPKMQDPLLLPQSLQLLTNLRTLYLCDQRLGDVSVVGKLSKLQFLSFFNCEIYELPNEIGELSNLRLLDLTDCRALERIPAGVISRLSKLEELCIGGRSFKRWEVASTSREQSNVSLSELLSLSHLTVLAVFMEDVLCLPKDFHFRNLKRKLCNIVPVLGSPYLEKVEIGHCNKLEFFQHEHTPLPSTLKELNFSYLPELQWIWKGPAHLANLQNLEVLRVRDCRGLMNLFPLHLAQSLVQLRILEIRMCEGLIQIIGDEDHQVRQSSLNHRQPVGFPKLEALIVEGCDKLKSLFSITIAQGLQQLKELKVVGASELEELFSEETKFDVGNEKEIVLPELSYLELRQLPSLISFCSGSYRFILPFLAELQVEDLPGMTMGASADLLYTMLSQGKNLRVLNVKRCNKSCAVFPAKFLVNSPDLKEVTVDDCNQIQEIFQLDEPIIEEEYMQLLSNLNTLNLSQEKEGVTGNGKKIELPYLKELLLQELPNLISFCSGSFQFVLSVAERRFQGE
ncbi:hypothetical protein F0562_008803 [Nyssa sinensis]|uniref:AAA+ ATPase domain-containing protein n=1 Tax=Nyssa sinensis TaxID=561372 RepID=A0A5J5AAC0_9ASTE|nr:hypothetical protein F0562_008803 [Nyssa sinensis]